ncbi:MAG: hypothetical protein J5828_00845 [Desulfovibrionaceae bacterium]|nr:hypothetical protein [Desulfovibrionaceae bacterium]
MAPSAILIGGGSFWGIRGQKCCCLDKAALLEDGSRLPADSRGGSGR